jgi:hypothetical protein
MTYQAIGLGTTVGDGTGDTIRAGGDKVNDNFVEIYSLLGTGTALTSGISATATVVTLAGPSITGVASFADGSNTAPSITNTGDTNTGIYFGAADTVNITTGGTKRIEIDSSGLDVTGNVTISTSAATTHNRISQTNSGGDAYNSDISASTTNRSWIYGAFDTAAGYSNGAWTIYDATAATTRLVIDSSGNVGIGTTAPTEKLDVVGNVTISGSIAVGSITVDNIIINGTNIGHTSDTDAIAIAANGVVTFSQIPVLPANSIDSDSYVDGSIDTAHIADNSITEAKMANDAISSAELKSLSTLLIKDSGGTTLATFHTAGA